jgi:hypothetical protein
MDVGDFLSRCSALKSVLTGEKDTDLADQKNLSWCTSHLSDILEDYRARVLKRNQVPKNSSYLPSRGHDQRWAAPDCARRAGNTGQIGEACQGYYEYVVCLVAV